MDFDVDNEPTEALDPLLLRAQMRVGTTLRGKWHLDVLLGIGGMATVYAATHRNGNRAAVKILHAELLLHKELRGRFLREGYLANAVGHEGAVKIVDDDVAEDGTMFLVTELLDGETLEDRRLRSGGSLPEQDVLWVADQILDVLVAAHSRGIVHRDLKPENIFVTRSGKLKVLDFGIARLRELSTISTATRAGVTLGTPAYMPPEQARGLGDEVESRSDLWACGATMFHLLSGRWVHRGRTHNEQLLSAMTRPADPCSSASPGVSLAVARVVDRALAFERRDRWPDAASMQEAVRKAYAELHRAPIGTAPRLVVPAHVADRTMPQGEDTLRSDTSRPVERSERPPVTIRGPMPLAAVVALGGAVALGAAIGVASWARGAAVRGAASSSAGPTTLQPVVVTASGPGARVLGAPTAPVALAQETATELSGSESADAAVRLDPPAASDGVTRHSLRQRPVQAGASPASSATPFGYKTDVPY